MGWIELQTNPLMAPQSSSDFERTAQSMTGSAGTSSDTMAERMTGAMSYGATSPARDSSTAAAEGVFAQSGTGVQKTIGATLAESVLADTRTYSYQIVRTSTAKYMGSTFGSATEEVLA